MTAVLLVQTEMGFWVRQMSPRVRARGHRGVLVTPPLSGADRDIAVALVDEIVELDDVLNVDALVGVGRRFGPDVRMLTCADTAMVSTAAAAERLGVLRTPARAYASARNKYATRQALAAAGLPNPRYALISRADDAAEVAAQVALPAIVKPMNGSGSNLVRAVRTVDELAAAYALLAERLPGSMGGLYDSPVDGVDPSRTFLVESRLVGPEFCVDVVLRDGVIEPFKLVGKPFMDEAFFEPVLVCPPFDLTGSQERGMLAAVANALAALGIDNTVAHVELIDDETLGPVIVEVNVGRPGGGLVAAMHQLTSGVDLFAECLAATIGDPPPVRVAPKATIPLAFISIFASEAGRLVRIHGLDDVAALPEVIDVVPVATPGQMLSADHEVFVVTLLVVGFFDADDLAAVYDEATKLVRVETEEIAA
jgi:biotin carboxylase